MIEHGLAFRLLMPVILFCLTTGCSPQSIPEIGSGRKITEEFLIEIQAGNMDEVWQKTSSEFKSYMGREQFKAFVASNPVLREKLHFQKEEPFPEGGRWVLCSFSPDKPVKMVKVFVGKEGDLWLVHGLKVE
ncbi:MAG: hypothetical protein ACO3GX_12615 [Gemmataceae bacterium]